MSTETVPHTAMTLVDHLPAIQVLLPFVMAPLVVVVGSRRLAWPLTFLASAAAFVVSILLLMQVIDGRLRDATRTGLLGKNGCYGTWASWSTF